MQAWSSGDRSRFSLGLIFKIVALSTFNALSLWTLFQLLPDRVWLGIAFVVVATIGVDVIFLTRLRWSIPFKYLAPGTLFLLLFQMYPVLYTAYISTTNLGTGHILNKQEAIDGLIRTSRRSTPSGIEFVMVPGRNDSGDIALLLSDPPTEDDPVPPVFIGSTDGLELAETVEYDDSGRVARADDYAGLTLRDIGRLSTEIPDIQQQIVSIEVQYERDGEAGVIVPQGITRAVLVEFGRTYDPETDTMFDRETQKTYFVEEGSFVSADGEELRPGWQASIGFDNYSRVLSSDAIRGPFFRVFLWNWAFAGGTVAFSFIVGLGLAIVLDHPKLWGKRLYRSLLIFPYALPSVLTVLVWRGMMNPSFGIINDLLPGPDIRWLITPWAARASVLLVSTWLSFPYFFLVCTGALQSIPKELTEAAEVDGASGPQAFRRITFPLLLIAVAPLLISSFAFNFNNFNVIFFLTRGDPPIPGAQTPAGATDILVSYTYQLAYNSPRGQELAFATAILVLIFIHIALFSAWGFRKTARLEEI